MSMRPKKFEWSIVWGKAAAKASAAAAAHGTLARLLQGAIDEWKHIRAGYAHARPIVSVGP